jgi:hypothetical protein
MANSKCPNCEGENFKIIPTFPGQSPFISNKLEITHTFSLKVQCSSCKAIFDVIDNRSLEAIEGLSRQIEFLKEQVNSLKYLFLGQKV